MMNPKVSIIIPVYNGSNYLKEAIDSALAQTYKNTEVIVVNDGSNDEGATDKIAKSYGKKIKYFKKENGGVATALNLGIENMTGEYFSWLSHDDLYYPEKIEKQVAEAIKFKKNTIIISDWVIINEDGKVIQQNVLDDRLTISPKCFLAFDRKTWLNACAMLIPKDLFNKNGNFDEALRTTQDYDMSNRLIDAGVKFHILHEPLMLSRTHSEQGSLSKSAINDSDLIHQKIINGLSDDEIKKYIGKNYSELISIYDSFFNNGYKRTPAHIVERSIKLAIKEGEKDFVGELIQKKLIGSGIVEKENDIQQLINKINHKSNKKRLLFCSGHWLTGGMERVLSILFNSYGQKYELFLLTPSDGRESSISLPDYVTHIKISDELFQVHFDTVALSHALLFGIDAITGFMNLFEKQLDCYQTCKDAGIKTIASNHEYYYYPYKSPYIHHQELVSKRLEVYKDVDAVLWSTNFSAAAYGMYCDNSYLLPNPNTFEIQKTKKAQNDDKVIICVGRFNDYIKRVDRIINCFKIIKSKQPDAKLLLVGTCDRAQPFQPNDNTTIDDLISKAGLNDKDITFVGEVNNVNKYYSQASLIMLTSNNEGFGMVLNEAACFGLPIVCNRIPGIDDIVTDGKNGYITEQDDLQAMADRVCKILADNKLRKELGQNAKELAKRFAADRISARWECLFDTLLSGKSQVEIKRELDKNLLYVVPDYEQFGKVIAKELNDIFYVSLQEKRGLIDTVASMRSLKRIRGYYSVVSEHLKTEGAVTTVKKISRKVYKKITKS